MGMCVRAECGAMKRPRINIAAGVNGQPNETIDSLAFAWIAWLFVAAGFLSLSLYSLIRFQYEIVFVCTLVECSFSGWFYLAGFVSLFLYLLWLALNLKELCQLTNRPHRAEFIHIHSTSMHTQWRIWNHHIKLTMITSSWLLCLKAEREKKNCKWWPNPCWKQIKRKFKPLFEINAA